MKSKLETIAYLAVIVVCVVILAERILQHPRSPPASIAVGDRSPILKSLVPEGAEKALFLVLSPSCSYCTESLPALAHLSSERDRSRSPVAVVAAVPSAEAVDAQRSILEEHGVDVDQLVRLDLQQLRIRGTPTVLLTSSEGEILGLWPGRMTSDRLPELTKAAFE